MRDIHLFAEHDDVGFDEDYSECDVYSQLKEAENDAAEYDDVDDKLDLFVEHLNRLNVVHPQTEQVESTVAAGVEVVDDDDDADDVYLNRSHCYCPDSMKLMLTMCFARFDYFCDCAMVANCEASRQWTRTHPVSTRPHSYSSLVTHFEHSQFGRLHCSQSRMMA